MIRPSRTVTTARSSGAGVSSSARGREQGHSGSNVPPSPARNTRLQAKQAKLASSQRPALTAVVSHDLAVTMESAAPVARQGTTASKATGRQAIGKGSSSKPLATVEEEAVEDTAAVHGSPATSDDVGEQITSGHRPLKR